MDSIEQQLCPFLSQSADSHCVRKGIDWLVAFTNPADTWRDEPTFLFIQFSVILGSFLNYLHARKHGGRFIHFWWATIIVSLVTECVCYLIPNIDNFWHAQGIIGLFGRRFPLYIVLIYNQFWYTAWVTVLRANLKWWAEPFAVGAVVVIFDLPYDIMGIKMLWWTWHDTDANIYDRHYHVPWTSYYFHSAFVAAMLFVFFGTRKLLMPSKGRLESGNCLLEWLCTILAGTLAMPVGSLVFLMLFYHPLHDWFDVHSEVPVLMWLAVCVLITWISDRSPSEKTRTGFTTQKLFSIPVLNVAQHFMLFIILMLVAEPANVKSTGLHQTIGPCNVTEDTFSISGAIMPRQKYLCPEAYDEPMDFHCLPDGKPPPDTSVWYTICGLPFVNAMEYRLIVWFCCGMGLLVYMQILLFSGDQPTAAVPSKPAKPSATSKQLTTTTAAVSKKQKKKQRKEHRD